MTDNSPFSVVITLEPAVAVVLVVVFLLLLLPHFIAKLFYPCHSGLLQTWLKYSEFYNHIQLRTDFI